MTFSPYRRLERNPFPLNAFLWPGLLMVRLYFLVTQTLSSGFGKLVDEPCKDFCPSAIISLFFLTGGDGLGWKGEGVGIGEVDGFFLVLLTQT